MYFMLKLHPSRPSFAVDMTEKERAIMTRHGEYWREFLEKGHAVAFGPVMDPAGPFGLGIVEVEGEAQLKDFIAGDPALTTGLTRLEYHPMRAVVRPHHPSN